MTTHQTGETITLGLSITGEASGAAIDPTTVTVSIQKPDGTMDVSDAAMTNDSVGEYHYDYDIPTGSGIYIAQYTGTGPSGRVTIKPDSFTVEDSI